MIGSNFDHYGKAAGHTDQFVGSPRMVSNPASYYVLHTLNAETRPHTAA